MAARRGQQQAAEQPDQRRYALLDPGYESGEQFCEELLITPDFNLSTLAPFAKGETKTAAAKLIAQQIVEGTLDPDELMRAYCRQSRQWLTIKTGHVPGTRPKKGDMADFLTKFGPANAWYGPIHDEEGDRTWFVHAGRDKYYIQQEGGTYSPHRLRWHVVAEVASRHVALHWNNFTYQDFTAPDADGNKRLTMVQFPYWLKIPGIMNGLLEELGADCDYKPPLHRVVLRTLMPKFDGEDGHTWKHLRIRAERDGVALNAHSAGSRDINVTGLRALTKAVARAVVKLSSNLSTQESRIEKAVLVTFIHEWGTKSYEFSLDKGEGHLFRAHCYFGVNLRDDDPDGEPDDGDDDGQTWESRGPDDFPHMKCYQTYGGSTGARDFILPYLLRP